MKSLELKTGKFEYESLIREINDIKDKEDDNIKLKESLSEEIKVNDMQLDKFQG
ncbi:MAG: hypothetical protein IPM38_09315 [Ignavibacteria bacterium]|nr:hypothetical protein [Ignavibacteria bacterium]